MPVNMLPLRPTSDRFAELNALIRTHRSKRAPRGSLRRELLNERAAQMRLKYARKAAGA